MFFVTQSFEIVDWRTLIFLHFSRLAAAVGDLRRVEGGAPSCRVPNQAESFGACAPSCRVPTQAESFFSFFDLRQPQVDFFPHLRQGISKTFVPEWFESMVCVGTDPSRRGCGVRVGPVGKVPGPVYEGEGGTDQTPLRFLRERKIDTFPEVVSSRQNLGSCIICSFFFDLRPTEVDKNQKEKKSDAHVGKSSVASPQIVDLRLQKSIFRSSF